jgi:hypothetical protein
LKALHRHAVKNKISYILADICLEEKDVSEPDWKSIQNWRKIKSDSALIII